MANDDWYEFVEDSLFRLMRLLDDDPDDWAVNAHDAIQDAWLRITDGTTATVHLANSEHYAARARMFEDALRKAGGE